MMTLTLYNVFNVGLKKNEDMTVDSNQFMDMTTLSATLTFSLKMCYNWICIVNDVTLCWQTSQIALVTVFGGSKVQIGNKNNERHVSVFWNCKSILIFDIYLTSEIGKDMCCVIENIFDKLTGYYFFNPCNISFSCTW